MSLAIAPSYDRVGPVTTTPPAYSPYCAEGEVSGGTAPEGQLHIDAFASALEVAREIREKKTSPVEVIDFYLERIERLNPELNAVT